MDKCLQPGLLSLGDALAKMRAVLYPINAYENIALLDAVDRVLAQPITSLIAVPGHDNSAMDGYAISCAGVSLGQPLKIIGQALAGHPFNGTVGHNECVRIMTGAVLPAGADTVAMQENVLQVADQITLTQLPEPHENVRRTGEDIAPGAQVFSAGHRLTPVDIGLLASIGIADVKVYRKLRVAVLTTGDELVPPGQPLAAGQIYDSNRYTLLALLQKLNLDILDLGLIPDRHEAIRAAFINGMQNADVVISTGGVSVGDADYTTAILNEVGQIHFWKIAIKPGKPFAFGSLHTLPENTPVWFFGLPGNPVSAVVTYHQLVLPALRQLAGEVFVPNPPLVAKTRHTLKKQPGRTDFQRGVLQNDGSVSTTGNQSSAVLTSLAHANCYIVLNQESGNVAAGEDVQVIMFDRFLK